MQKKVFLIMGIVIVACAIWISCDNNMPEMYKIGGSSTSYYYNDTLDSYDGPNNECDTGFWAETKDRLWQELYGQRARNWDVMFIKTLPLELLLQEKPNMVQN